MNSSDIIMLTLRLLAFAFGLALVVETIIAAIKTFLVPRGVQVWLTYEVFLAVRKLFALRLHGKNYEERDRIMAFYAPLTLFLMPIVLLVLIDVGYMLMFWAVEPRPFFEIFEISGSSLLTLGSAEVETFPSKILEFTEATIGLVLIALLIAYLPTMYAAFSRRETAVSVWDARAGSPPTVEEMAGRTFRTGELGMLRDIWLEWEVWFAELEESHTSLWSLAFFRSPVSNRSWVTACGNVLDCAAFILTTVDAPNEPRAAFCLRSGFLALRQIADFFNLPYDPNPQQGDPISISRDEYDDVCAALAAQGVPLRPDRDETWRHFAGWRVNYDAALLQLAALTMAPYAPWISDRSVAKRPTKTGNQQFRR
ncbi:MAG: hypothetical protein KJ069_31850 [Anaerolineae bacterium]|nr:hypothetical protein [Anaerolineae bacterium]